MQEKVEAYRNRPIKKWYPIIFIDGTVINIRRGSVDGEVVYVALGIDEDGYREVLGFWLGGSEGESADIRRSSMSFKGGGLKSHFCL